ncbi:MAG: AMP-binding protein [Burkholderiaceae bacterium]
MSLPRSAFPSILPPELAQALHVADQLRAHARSPASEQARLENAQLVHLLAHARRYSPFWRARLDAARARREGGERTALADLPVLTRRELQDNADAMRAHWPGLGSEDVHVARTSGSVGQPVRVEHYLPAYRPMYGAIARLDDEWQGRDRSRPLAVVRDLPDGARPGWGGLRLPSERAGEVRLRNLVDHTPQALADWLAEVRPGYLVTTPSMAGELARIALARGDDRVRLHQVMTFAEVVTPELRRLVNDAFGARITDRYSCEELGWIAMQCPKHDHLHVMSSNVLLEVVDDAGRPCGPGRPGRILVTGLLGYAMPLVRYELGDHGELGEACDCGLTLPVLRRVIGRSRSFLRHRDGTLRQARLTGEYWREVAPVREYRVVQYADGLVEAFVTGDAAFDEAQRERMRAMLGRVLGDDLEIVVTQVERIDWGSRWKRIDVARIDRLRGEPIPDAPPA